MNFHFMLILIKYLIFGYWISVKINLIPRLHFERDILYIVGVLPFNELYHHYFVIISTVQLKIFSMLMLKSAIRIFKKFGLLVLLSYPYFHCQQIKKKEKRFHDLLPLPLEHLLNQSDQSSHLTQTDAVLSFKAHA